jgi:hypothetical protein
VHLQLHVRTCSCTCGRKHDGMGASQLLSLRWVQLLVWFLSLKPSNKSRPQTSLWNTLLARRLPLAVLCALCSMLFKWFEPSLALRLRRQLTTGQATGVCNKRPRLCMCSADSVAALLIPVGWSPGRQFTWVVHNATAGWAALDESITVNLIAAGGR